MFYYIIASNLRVIVKKKNYIQRDDNVLVSYEQLLYVYNVI